ncbi:MAG: hypothetical protein M1561_05500 [Gammaproteobacteria bacterium]|nr:hypothetical protein [Gammaproteobacteria bacterium]
MKNEELKISCNNCHGIFVTLLFCLALLIFTVYTFFPGFLNLDSEFQMQQGMSHHYTDWHPPIMAYFWSLLAHIYPGPAVILVLHNILFWSALFLLSLLLVPQTIWLRFLIILAFAFYPPIYIQLGGIWKDCAMSLSLFLASVLLCYLSANIPRNLLRVVTISIIVLLFFYAYAVRLNSLPAVLILCWWFGYILFPKHLWRSLVFAICLVAAFFVVNKVIVERLVHPLHTYPFQQVAIHDLAAISIANNKMLFPEYITQAKKVTMEQIRAKYTPDSVGYLIFGEHLIALTPNANKIDKLMHLWWQSVLHNPWVYLQHRTRCLIALMISGIDHRGEVCLEPFHIIFHPTYFYNLYCKFVRSPVINDIFHGGVYVFESLLALILAIRLRKTLSHSQAIIFLTLSGLLYTFGGFFYIPACEFRYLYWVVIATMLAWYILIRDVLGKTIKN